MLTSLVIIPARYESSRLPGKPLIDICGKPMIQHVFEQASQAEGIEKVLVATDDKRIFDAVNGFGGEAVMTSSDHLTGTDRVAEASFSINTDVIINVQGDEPQIIPQMISSVAEPFKTDKTLKMVTLAAKIADRDCCLSDPNIVKVVMDIEDFALYFSRYPIPFSRDTDSAQSKVIHYKHIGLYAYTKQFLLNFVKMPQTPLENAEKLEQLRALEHGVKIKVLKTPYDVIGVDTPQDLEKVRKGLIV